MKLILAYKSSGKSFGSCHAGLGTTCRNIANSLKREGYYCDVWPIAGGDDLQAKLRANKQSSITHVVVAAPFIPSNWMIGLAQEFINITFAVTSHSNVGFLQAESAAIKLMREYAEAGVTEHNLWAAANNHRLVEAFHLTYGRKILCLPNLYDIEATPRTQASVSRGSVLRIGSFGALRVQKNFTSAAWAAVAIARKRRMALEYYVNIGRDDNNGGVVERSIRATLNGLPNVTLMPIKWHSTIEFRRLVSHMHLLIQPSYSETFSMVTADAIAEGVPVVASSAVEWVPNDWKADADDVADIARVGERLIFEESPCPYREWEGYQALAGHNKKALKLWKTFLAV